MGHSNLVQTRLSEQDRKRLEKHLAETGKTQAEAVRESIRFYLANYATKTHDQRESELVKAVNAMANRVCAMLNRQGQEIGTLYEITYQTMQDESFFEACLNKTKERLKKRQTQDEKILAARKAKIITEPLESIEKTPKEE